MGRSPSRKWRISCRDIVRARPTLERRPGRARQALENRSSAARVAQNIDESSIAQSASSHWAGSYTTSHSRRRATPGRFFARADVEKAAAGNTRVGRPAGARGLLRGGRREHLTRWIDVIRSPLSLDPRAGPASRGKITPDAARERAKQSSYATLTELRAIGRA